MQKNAIWFISLFLFALVSTSTVLAVEADVDPLGDTAGCLTLSYSMRYQSRDSETNNEVSALQDYLQSSGYLDSNPSGYFGQMTLKAVKSFQGANDISPTGYVGSITRGKIYTLSCGQTTTTTSSSQKTDKPEKATSSVASASFDSASLTTTSQTPKLYGKASNVSEPFGVSISNAGGKVWASGSLKVSGSKWSTTVSQKLDVGTYTVQLYSNNVLVATETLTIKTTTKKPSCTLYTNKTSYKAGETIYLSWTSKETIYAIWQPDNSGKDYLVLPTDKQSSSGTIYTNATVVGTPPVTLMVVGEGGTATCSMKVKVTEAATVSVSLDQSTLKVTPNTTFNISGVSSVSSGNLYVVLIGPSYAGSTDWNTVSSFLKGESSYTGTTLNTAYLSSTKWSVPFGGIATEGYYTIYVYDASFNLVSSGTLWVTYKG